MKKLLLTTCLSLIFFSGTTLFAQDGKYRIKGTIDSSFDGQYAILSVKDDYRNIIRSDTSVISQGEFSFKGNEYLENLSSIVIKDMYGVITRKSCGLMLESGTILISYHNKLPLIKGTTLNENFITYKDSLNLLYANIDQIDPEWKIHLNFVRNSDSGTAQYKVGEYMISFIKQNFSNPLGKALLMSGLEAGNFSLYLYIIWNKRTFDEIFAFVDEQTKAHPRFIKYATTVKKAMEKSPFVGKKIEPHKLSTPDGTTICISDYIGKKEYTFVEFWASWCSPCLQAIPYLKNVYADHSEELEIISISLDTNNEAWLSALKVQNMPWTQLSAPEGFKSEIAKEFDITAIPFGLLLDKDGVIITPATAQTLKFVLDVKTKEKELKQAENK